MSKISQSSIDSAIDAIAGVDGLYMDANYLVEDVYLLAYAYKQEPAFQSAVANTVRALEQIVAGKVSAAALKHNLESWQSYHFQSSVGQGSKADCRIIFKQRANGIEVRTFGNRHIPEDIYTRLSTTRQQ
jgi:predicted nucleic-acid-binding protein